MTHLVEVPMRWINGARLLGVHNEDPNDAQWFSKLTTQPCSYYLPGTQNTTGEPYVDWRGKVSTAVCSGVTEEIFGKSDASKTQGRLVLHGRLPPGALTCISPPVQKTVVVNLPKEALTKFSEQQYPMTLFFYPNEEYQTAPIDVHPPGAATIQGLRDTVTRTPAPFLG